MSSNHYPEVSSEESDDIQGGGIGYIVMNSDRRGKRYVAIPTTEGQGKIIHFGSDAHSNFTMHKDPKRKLSYLKRHGNEDWTDLNKAGTWSRYLLWNLPTLQESARDMENHFGIKITLAI